MTEHVAPAGGLPVSDGPTIDVSDLPRHGFGRTSALFWGLLALIAIETTALAIMFASYLYVRGNFDEWPPSERMRLAPGILTTIMMLVSCIPMQMSMKPCHELELVKTRRLVMVAVLLGFAACALRAWEIASLPFLWTENVYASLVWTTYGMHTVELGASVLESLVMAAVLYRGPVEDKHYEDVEVTAIFWWFANVVWIPFAALFYIDGALR
mgnify:CR=1 FL=1